MPGESPLSTLSTPSASPVPEMKPVPGIKRNVKIKPDEIQLLAKYIYGISGIHLEASKSYLLETRLGRLLEAENCRILPQGQNRRFQGA